MEVQNTKRIVLLGKSGNGKSSLANTIFGEPVFKVTNFKDSDKSVSQAESRCIDGRSLTLIDTPGLFDPNKSEEDMAPEMKRCIIESAPGPHVFLIVLKVEKFAEQEQRVISRILKYFSDDALKHAVVVFTHGDQLPEEMKIEEYVGQSQALKDLVEKCGGRCHIFDNKYWKGNQEDDYRNNQFQVTKLLETLDTIENAKGYYTNPDLQEMESEIQKEEEQIRRSSKNLSQEQIRKQAISNIIRKQVEGGAESWKKLFMGLAITGLAVSVVSAVLITLKNRLVPSPEMLESTTEIMESLVVEQAQKAENAVSEAVLASATEQVSEAVLASATERVSEAVLASATEQVSEAVLASATERVSEAVLTAATEQVDIVTEETIQNGVEAILNRMQDIFEKTFDPFNLFQ